MILTKNYVSISVMIIVFGLVFSNNSLAKTIKEIPPSIILDSVVARTNPKQKQVNFQLQFAGFDQYGQDSIIFDEDFIWIETYNGLKSYSFFTDIYPLEKYNAVLIDTIFNEKVRFFASECKEKPEYRLKSMTLYSDSLYYFTIYPGVLDNYSSYGQDKPVIYLYAPDSINFTIDLELKGEKIFVYPNNEESSKDNNLISWSGKLVDDQIEIKGKNYPYLFWEGKSSIRPIMDKGFCVEGDSVVQFLETILDKVGLNSTEKTDFITYWAPKMTQNKFNLIHFKTTEQYDEIAEIFVSPTPDAVLRLYMYYEPIEVFKLIQPQQFSLFKREGFTVTEWGGSELPRKIN